MFSRILVAIDRSEMSQQVFERALWLALPTNAALMLQHVLCIDEWESLNLPAYYAPEYLFLDDEPMRGTYSQQWQTYENECLEDLRSLADQAQAAGINAEFTLNSGRPGAVICKLAQNWKADLIVTGRRGRSGLSELVLGSVSNYILHRAPCSVLVVQNQSYTPPSSIEERKEHAWKTPLRLRSYPNANPHDS